ncbi:DUF3370 family protein [Cyanobium sp. WAJ14-Wanaka]|uniref:DUF3370 family protein n=1 Tax=Cyanobium sp. WAJ14-Wanaka TaxID=2823725 RepID=UPI0028F42A47|nr:DUF3370 family protein [Cyanobium sp. WAJ14-Wanaka]MCP9774548.1 DUF3370 family protein [Cyanobium sp. WAJ14-Wanaka]
MAGQRAQPLNGSFNKVPVLHSNQPEEVEGPGILISTSPGSSYAAEGGAALTNSAYTFNGEFGIHLHHKYFPSENKRFSGDRRSELTLGMILINPGYEPVHIRFQSGAVRNSFEAPYLANNLMGVKPLGIRPWNTGPGDATATQMLRGKLDSNLSEEITIPGRSRIVLFKTELPSLGIANALLKGRSDGPFQMAVVAAKNPGSDYDIVAVLDEGMLAPGRVYLNRVNDIKNKLVFSRVGGVAIGDLYQASLSHNLETQGPLHVPFTSTDRTNFGTKEIQVNQLASRMIDSSLNNVGTYGVRFEVTLNLTGSGPYELVLSHPVVYGKSKPIVAFRGSIQIETDEGDEDIHVGLKSGESLPLKSLYLRANQVNRIKVVMVYPADATPGHLLSVVPASQLATFQEQEKQAAIARATETNNVRKMIIPPDLQPPASAEFGTFIMRLPVIDAPLTPPPMLRSDQIPYQVPGGLNQSLIDSYQESIEFQQRLIKSPLDR